MYMFNKVSRLREGFKRSFFLKVLVVIATGMGGGGPRLSSELLLKRDFLKTPP